MIPNLKANTAYAIHLRALSTSGGKDWVGSVTSQGEIHTFWGKTNQVNQHAAKPGDISELRKIINQKQNGKDKYKQVDEYTPQQGWQRQRMEGATPQHPISELVPIVDWSIAPPDISIQWDF